MYPFENIGIIPIDYSVLKSIFRNYKSPKDKIASLEKKGDIIRLKKGLYILSSKWHNKTFSKALIANHIYGPSYVTSDWALNYYGIIPERVYTVLSGTLKRSRKFDTQMGNYEYMHLPDDYFSIGINQETEGMEYSFLIASPEKALCDKIISTNRLRLQSLKAVKEYLEDDLRCDFSVLSGIDKNIIYNCFQARNGKIEFKYLLKYFELNF